MHAPPPRRAAREQGPATNHSATPTEVEKALAEVTQSGDQDIPLEDVDWND